MLRRMKKIALMAFMSSMLAVSGIALGATPAFADQPAIVRAMNDDVLSTYYHYECPNRISGHMLDYTRPISCSRSSMGMPMTAIRLRAAGRPKIAPVAGEPFSIEFAITTLGSKLSAAHFM